MPDYGVDMMCGTDLDALLRDDEGEGMMQRVCVRRLYCRKGRMLSAPNAFTVDARDFISQGIDGAAGLATVKAICQQALLDDERIFEAHVTATFDYASRELTLQITGVGATGPFAGTVVATELTVALLGGDA